MVLLLLCLAAFLAGFVDSIVGGGGLIQLPALMALLPSSSMPLLLGTNKFSSIFGTCMAIFRYSRNRVAVPVKLVGVFAVIAFFASWWGAHEVTRISSQAVKPIVMVLLLGVLLFTFARKDFGFRSRPRRVSKNLFVKICFWILVIGFYDGFLGPGTGGFLIFVFVTMLGLDFLSASASAKWVNAATNISAVIYFLYSGLVSFEYAIPMAAMNMTGSFLGTHLALRKGAPFVRLLFLFVVSGIFLKLSYDLFVQLK